MPDYTSPGTIQNKVLPVCCSSISVVVTGVFLNELLRPLTGLSDFCSLSSSSRSQLRSKESPFHWPPLTVLSIPLHTLPGLHGNSGSIEEDEADGELGSVECWGTSHRGLSLLDSQPSGAPLSRGCSHCGATREEDGWVVTVFCMGAGCSTCCLWERGSSEAGRSKEFLCVDERWAEDETPTGVIGGSGVCDFSCTSIIARLAVSNGCEFKLWCRWELLPSPPFLSSCRWGLTPRKLCPEDTGLENKESETWKSWRSIGVL